MASPGRVSITMSAAHGQVVNAWLQANKGPQQMLDLLRQINQQSGQAGAKGQQAFGGMAKQAQTFAKAMFGVGTAFQAAHTAIAAIRAEFDAIQKVRRTAADKQVEFGRALVSLGQTIPETTAIRDISTTELRERILKNLYGRTPSEMADLVQTAVSQDVGSTLSERAAVAFTGAKHFPAMSMEELNTVTSAVLGARRRFTPEVVTPEKGFGLFSSIKSVAFTKEPAAVAELMKAINRQAGLLRLRERFGDDPEKMQRLLNELVTETIAVTNVGELGQDPTTVTTNTLKQLGQLQEELRGAVQTGDVTPERAAAAQAALDSGSVVRMKQFAGDDPIISQKMLGAFVTMFGRELSEEVRRQINEDIRAGRDPAKRLRRGARTREKTLLPVLEGFAPSDVETGLTRAREGIAGELKTGADAVVQMVAQLQRMQENPANLPFFMNIAQRDAQARLEVGNITRAVLGQIQKQLEQATTAGDSLVVTKLRAIIEGMQSEEQTPVEAMHRMRAIVADMALRRADRDIRAQERNVNPLTVDVNRQPTLRENAARDVEVLTELLRSIDAILQRLVAAQQPGAAQPAPAPVNVPAEAVPASSGGIQAIPGQRVIGLGPGIDRIINFLE
jgi:hypothetical protein